MYDSENLPLSPLRPLKRTLSRLAYWFTPILMVSAIYLPLYWLGTLAYEDGDAMPLLVFYTTNYYLWFLLVIIVYLILVYIYEYYYVKRYYYKFSDSEVTITRGVFKRETGNVLYKRIQNISMDQDFFDLVLGLYDVHFETAGEIFGIYTHIDGLNKENAEKLLNFLKERQKSEINSR